MSAFQYEACHGFHAGASVHKLFVGGVYASLGLIELTTYSLVTAAQQARTIGSTSIEHRSDTLVSDRCLIDVDPNVVAIWVHALANLAIIHLDNTYQGLLQYKASLQNSS